MENVLKNIVDKKKEKISNLKKILPVNNILNNIKEIDNFIRNNKSRRRI